MKFAANAMCGSIVLERRLDNGNENAAPFQHLPRARLRFTADRIENNINLSHHILEWRGPVIYYFISSHLAHEIKMLRGSSADDVRSFPFGELNSVIAHASGSGMNQHFLPALQIRDIKKGLPRGHGGDWQCCRLDVVQIGRFFDKLSCRRNDEFRVTAALIADNSKHVLANMKIGHIAA